MAICANNRRAYMGNTRQYMDPCHCQKDCDCQKPQIKSYHECYEDVKKNDCCEKYDDCCDKPDGCHPECICADMPLAVAYVNGQPFTGLVCAETALCRGSAFNNLYDPWHPGQGYACR